MPTFIAIGYGNQAGYDDTPQELRNRVHKHDDKLRHLGARMGIAGDPVQVRNTEGRGIHRKDGAYLRSDLPVAGFSLTEADDLDHAIALVSETPCAIAHGVVEVWLLKE